MRRPRSCRDGHRPPARGRGRRSAIGAALGRSGSAAPAAGPADEPASSSRCRAASTARSRRRSSRDAGHEAIGVWMRLHDVADSYSEFKKSCCCLDAADDARRVAARLGIPFYVHEPGARVRRRRHPAVPGRLPRRPDAEPVRRLQHVREVRGPARPGAPPVRLRRGRDRPLRPARRCGPGRRRPAAHAPSTGPRTRPTSCTACARTSWPTPGSRSAS